MTPDPAAVLDPAPTDVTDLDETIETLDADFERERAALVAEEARDMVIRFLDVLLSGDRDIIARRIDNPSAVGTVIATMTAEGWSVDETADAVIEAHRVAAHLAHQAFIRAVADGYDYATLVEGVHAEAAPWHGMVRYSDLTVAVAVATSGHLDNAALLRSRTLDGLLVCAAHTLASTTFTEEFGWLDFAADTVGATLIDD